VKPGRLTWAPDLGDPVLESAYAHG